MGARTVRCTSCSHEWPARDARFCGRCGELLPRPPERVRALPRPAARGALTAAVLVSAGLVLVVASGTTDRTVHGGDPRVDLDQDVLILGGPLSDDEVTAVRRRADPGRLRCEPRGCELWWAPRGMLPPRDVVLLEDVAVLLTDDQLIAIDRATSQARWSTTLDAVPRTSEGRVRWVAGWEILSPGPADSVVVVAVPGLTSVDASGDIAWEFVPTVGSIRDAWVGDDIVVAHAGPDQDGGEVLVGLDPGDGSTRWHRTVRSVRSMEDGLLVVWPDTDRGLTSIDPSTGTTRWEREDLQGARVELAGPWLVLPGRAASALLDRDTGQDLPHPLAGRLLQPPARAGDHWLVVIDTIAARPTGTTRFQLVALDGAATPVWELPLEDPSPTGCCALFPETDADTVSVIDGRGEFRIDPATGATIDAPRTDADIRTPPITGIRVWHGDEGVVVDWDEDGLTLRTAAQATVRVTHDRGAWIESLDPLVIGSRGELLGVRPVDDG